MFKLTNKTAIVTGGGSGIGAAISLVFARQGAKVFIFDVDPEGGNQTVAQIQQEGGSAYFNAVDVTRLDQVKQAIQAVMNTTGRLDILVNNAGMTQFVPADDLEGLEDEVIDTIFKVNWRGAFATVRSLKSLLLKSGDGLVVNISSIAGTTGIGSNVAYCASKSAMNTMTISLARALAPKVRVISVAPGLVEGEYTDKLDPTWTEQQRQLNPLQRLTTATDVAQAVLACATLLKYSTGCVIPVDGGRPLT